MNQINQQEEEQPAVELNIKSNIDLYGLLIQDSIKLESNLLISCLDDILRIFNDYFKYISKVIMNN